MKSPMFMVVFFVIGLSLSIAHCAFYRGLDGKIVGSPYSQEQNLRLGTAFSFISQLALTACAWKSYTQWLWRAVQKKKWTVNGLNKAFGADTSPSSIASLEMIRNFKLGTLVAFFAWCLVLPPFFTPATLFVYQSEEATEIEQNVPYLSIAHSDAGKKYAYSPPLNKSTIKSETDTSREFVGPRTILTLLSTAAASQGEILSIKAPYNHSSYDTHFYGPVVVCSDANTSTVSIIEEFLREQAAEPVGTAYLNESAYYAFVPAWDSNGELIAMDEPRYQQPTNATNELWLTFQRYAFSDDMERAAERKYQVCRLHNATYDLSLSWDRGFQDITGSYAVKEEVSFPHDKMGDISKYAQHAYSAFMWTLTDQLVGSFAWYIESEPSPFRPAQFGDINSPIQRNSLLGSSDLDVFFDFNTEKRLYLWDPDQASHLSDQRKQDKALARNRTLAVLIEELSFNITDIAGAAEDPQIDSDNEASAEVWAWGLAQNPGVKGIYIAEPRWVNLGYYMTSKDFGRCIGLVGKLQPPLEGGDPPLTTVLAGRMTLEIIDSRQVDGRPLNEEERKLLMRCIKPENGGKEDSVKHARLVAMDYLSTMRTRCKRFDAYIDVSCLNRLQIPINLKTHYHDELVARTAEELDAFHKIMEMPTDDEVVIEQRRTELREWYSKALDRKKAEFGGEYPIGDISYDHLRDEIRKHDKTIAFGGASLTALQEILETEPLLGKKIHYYQQGGTFDSKLNILGNPYNFALNTKAAEYVFAHHKELASFTLIPTDTTKKIEWTVKGLTRLSPAVGVRSLAFHGRYDPWEMISPKERSVGSTKTDEFMTWRSEWINDPLYSTPDSKGYKAVMADLTAFLAAFTDAFKEFKTKEGVIKQVSIRVAMEQTIPNSNQMVLTKFEGSSIKCLMLDMPDHSQGVLVEDALGLVDSALQTISPTI
ncbi:hypothetical protein VMCG_07140 [Cytospora schulzeri]|uniref:Uncharacterized protein n=1 Tax=Cytospora schulzeri TaxID=448051 RepID=A0A423W4R8_9PEZI|nr:hypothetical protein VMCG_07140 [Valsa malicola]